MKLNIGSGLLNKNQFWAKDGWVNVDFAAFEQDKGDWSQAEYMNFDLSGGWPIPPETVDCIYASHIIEHFDYRMVWEVLKQCYRVLKPGAPMRIICPDPRIFFSNWQSKNKQFLLDCYGEENYKRWDYEKYPNIGFTDMFFGDHYSHALCASIDFIKIMLVRLGFTKVTEMAYANTEFPQYFGDYNNTTDNRPYMSWFLESVK